MLTLDFRLPARRGILLCLMLFYPAFAGAQTSVPDAVLDILDNKCMSCHEGAKPAGKLDLTEEFIPGNLINQPSRQIPELKLIVPGNPERSYFIQKILGGSGIKGKVMPRKGEKVTAAELEVLKSWIRGLPSEPGKNTARQETAVPAFPTLTAGNLPTAELLPAKTFLYRIAHRFLGSITEAGFDQLYGLDYGSNVMTQLTFPLFGGGNLTVQRSAIFATFEVAAKYRLLHSGEDNPFSMAIYGGFDWASAGGLRDPADINTTMGRLAGERFAWFAQLPASKRFGRLSLLAVPGVLINGNILKTDESPLVTFGLAGRYALNENMAIFSEIVPILSGSDTANPVGGVLFNEEGRRIFYDTFVFGVEIEKGGHVFHVFVTNSGGTTTGQYMSGANFNALDGDLRIGFNIYRLLDLP